MELLAPAGNMEKMKTALAFGADAVYAGVPDFSLRVRINDFDLEKIKKAREYCHERSKKIYITINIFAHNKHLKKIPKYLRALKRMKVDALIVSDPGIINMIKTEWPEAEIHLSTQANCTNWQSARFWHEQGVKRIILGREVSLEEIKKIHKENPSLELEYFVHGAMCMAYSGRCFLSKMYLNTSANLGDCAQPCRWRYTTRARQQKKLDTQNKPNYEIQAEGHDEILELVEEEHGSYLLNSRDLCLLKYLKDLGKAGVSSFKIEGRAKSVYYQAMVAGVYARVLEELKTIRQKDLFYYYKELSEKLVHRGYTEGFLLGESAEQNSISSHLKCDWEFCGQVISQKKHNDTIHTPPGKKSFILKIHNTLRLGDELEILCPKYDIIKIRVNKMLDADTGKEIREAHGGQGQRVVLAVNKKIPKFSVVRRRIRKE